MSAHLEKTHICGDCRLGLYADAQVCPGCGGHYIAPRGRVKRSLSVVRGKYKKAMDLREQYDNQAIDDANEGNE